MSHLRTYKKETTLHLPGFIGLLFFILLIVGIADIYAYSLLVKTRGELSSLSIQIDGIEAENSKMRSEMYEVTDSKYLLSKVEALGYGKPERVGKLAVSKEWEVADVSVR